MFIPKLTYGYDQPNDRKMVLACKFSRNKPNLHILGCSLANGEIIIQNTRSNYSNTLKRVNPQRKYKIKQYYTLIFKIIFRQIHNIIVSIIFIDRLG